MNLNEEIQKQTDVFIQEKLPTVINEKVGKLVEDILGDIFRSYSDTGKKIKESIEKQLDVNLQQFELADYNAMISKAIKEKLVGIINDQSIKPIMGMIDEVVGFIEKKTIKLSEIYEMVLAAAKEEDYNYKGSGEFTFIVEHNEQHDWYEIYYDPEADKKESRNCSLKFIFGKEGKIFSFRVGSYFSNTQPITPARMVNLSNLEHRIFRLYAAQVKIEVDETDFQQAWDRAWD